MPHATRDSPPLHPWLRSSDESAFHLNIHYQTETGRKVRMCRTNCRNIEIPILYPSSNFDIPGLGAEGTYRSAGAYQSAGNADSPMLADTNVSIPARGSSTVQVPANPLSSNSSSLLTLPFELRLQIYSYLLPPQTHTIVSQYPSSGSYYSSTPEYSAQSLYPSTYFPTSSRPPLTTYSIRDREIPIYPEILRVCKQTYEEAESVLYRSKGVVFNFDTYLDAVLPFLQDRSIYARRSIRTIRITMDMPQFSLLDPSYTDFMVKKVGSTEAGRKLREICEVLAGSKEVRSVDLVVWGSIAENADNSHLSTSDFPLLTNPNPLPLLNNDTDISSSIVDTSTALVDLRKAWKTRNLQIREIEWVKELLNVEALKDIGVTLLNFCALGGKR